MVTGPSKFSTVPRHFVRMLLRMSYCTSVVLVDRAVAKVAGQPFRAVVAEVSWRPRQPRCRCGSSGVANGVIAVTCWSLLVLDRPQGGALAGQGW
jgi:hypothetical protein